MNSSFRRSSPSFTSVRIKVSTIHCNIFPRSFDILFLIVVANEKTNIQVEYPRQVAL